MYHLVWRDLNLGFTAKIDQTVSFVVGLSPQDLFARSILPSAGVVSKVFVKDGEEVTQGQPLFDVEAKGLSSRSQALEPPSLYLSFRHAPSLASYEAVEHLRALRIFHRFLLLKTLSLNEQLITARQQSQQFRSQLEQLETRLKVVVQR